MTKSWKGEIVVIARSFWAITTFVTMFLKSPLLQRRQTLSIWEKGFNPFPQIDTFWRLRSRRLFENIVTKEEIALNVQFLLLPQCFVVWGKGLSNHFFSHRYISCRQLLKYHISLIVMHFIHTFFFLQKMNRF